MGNKRRVVSKGQPFLLLIQIKKLKYQVISSFTGKYDFL